MEEMTFKNLGLSEQMLKALEKKGYGYPTTIQQQAIPEFMQWKDVIAKAPTGTGKTFAFGIPMIEHVDPQCADVQGLILAPTRELAIQIGDELRGLLTYYSGIRVAVLNANGQPADFSRITFRVTEGWNYSSNMRYWDSTVVRDDEGYFYFDFASFQSAGNPAGADIYDYMKSYAKGISMLCYGGDAEGTCYYSAVELYRVKGTVQKNALKDAVRQL